VCVRTEEINISGSLFRNQMLWAHYLRKRMNTNPRRGPYHFRAPAKILWRTIRGMLPHKTPHGAAALGRYRGFEGCPSPYDKVKKVVVPTTLAVLKLKPGRKFCKLGDLASSVGWKHQALIKRLEAKRLARGAAFHQAKKQIAKLQAKAVAQTSKDTAAINAELAKYGF